VTGQTRRTGPSRGQAPAPRGRRAQQSDGEQVSPLVRAGHMVVLFLIVAPIVLVLSGVALVLVILLFAAVG
jgi:hypothetical protein